jgi:hypothetical protein
VAITAVAAVALLAAGCGSARKVAAPPPPTTTTTSTTVAPTTTTTDPCPTVPTPAATPTQLATQNTASLAYSSTPGGRTVGQLTLQRWGGPTVRPVASQQADWVQVRLDRRPNGSTAWVRLQDVTLSQTPYRIVVSICRRSLTLFQADVPTYTSPVGVGQPQWATPVGPTFVSALVVTPRRQLYIYGPTVLILGLHSNVFTEFDGGDGTVAIHGYPSDPASTNGVASSHGCIRAGPQTISTIKNVPVGTPVDVIA